MAEIKWIKIATDIFDDEKILLIEAMPDADAIIVIWFKLLTLAGKQNNSGVLLINDTIPYTDEMLATIFRRPLNTVRLALDVFCKFGMIDIIEDTITIPKWEKHQNIDGMERIREQTRQRVAKHREKQRLIECNVTVTECNATDKDKDKDKDKKKNINNISRSKLDEEFEQIWEIYPNKKGKADARKKFEKARKEGVTFDEMENGVHAYLAYLKAEHIEDRYVKMGSTFFNQRAWEDDWSVRSSYTLPSTTEEGQDILDEFF